MVLLSKAGLAAVAVTFALALLAGCGAKKKTEHHYTALGEPICITNLAQQYISDKKILNDIPAWEHALNVDFAGYWHTTQYRFVFMGRKPAPAGCISAVFQNKGPVQGALAYHWTERNNLPSITVYAGTGDYYGYDNSVSMTHELFEMAADPQTSLLNQGYPDQVYYIETPRLGVKPFADDAIAWFNETADPVEADFYNLPGANGKAVKISDFVTPAWFNDGTGDRFDFMGLCQQPFWIRPGGYAQFLDFIGWNIVENFRKNHATDRGFFLSDPRGRV